MLAPSRVISTYPIASYCQFAENPASAFIVRVYES